jgi:2-keto-4-pentenoate hydratase/2-oxohepta-3-ene-1,7-dioic acid hydratase in catechol pathway
VQLVTLAAERGAGVVIGEEILAFARCRSAIRPARLIPSTVRGMLEAGEAALDLVRRVADEVATRPALAERLREMGALIARDGARLRAPITDPGLILSCGLNYHAHLREMNTPVPAAPTAFTKNVAQLIGSGEAIVLPQSHPDMVDWEGEFSAVIGRTCHNISERDALDYVAGYTLINDVSARDWVAPVFSATGVMGPILAWEQNLLGKQFPTFCPMGPALVTRDEIPDPENVELATLLNGTVMQSANTSDLVFSVRKLIAYYSQFYRFEPGDVITTGSPSGVGYGRDPKVFMRDGDRVDVRAGGIGVLTNPVRRASPLP